MYVMYTPYTSLPEAAEDVVERSLAKPSIDRTTACWTSFGLPFELPFRLPAGNWPADGVLFLPEGRTWSGGESCTIEESRVGGPQGPLCY